MSGDLAVDHFLLLFSFLYTYTLQGAKHAHLYKAYFAVDHFVLVFLRFFGKNALHHALVYRKPVADDSLWPFYSRNEPRYFILNGEVRGVGHGPRATACAFWNEFMPLITACQKSI